MIDFEFEPQVAGQLKMYHAVAKQMIETLGGTLETEVKQKSEKPAAKKKP